jgi:hypothetical protein
MSLEKIALERIRAQSNARPILREVIPEFMTLGHEPAHQLLLPRDALSNQKECCPGALTVQLRQNQRGRARVGAIIDRQRKERRPGRHSVQAARIPPCEMVDEPRWGSPERRGCGNRDHSRQPKANPLRPSHVDDARLLV